MTQTTETAKRIDKGHAEAKPENNARHIHKPNGGASNSNSNFAPLTGQQKGPHNNNNNTHTHSLIQNRPIQINT